MYIKCILKNVNIANYKRVTTTSDFEIKNRNVLPFSKFYFLIHPVGNTHVIQYYT